MKGLRIVPRLKRVFFDYSRHSRRCAREFQITFEQFKEITAQDCYYCGAKPTRKKHRVFTKAYGRELVQSREAWNGIDRKNNKVGYVYTNCLPCCETCNRLKSDHALEEFFEHIVKIHRHRNL